MEGGSEGPRECPDFPRAKGTNRSYKVVYRGSFDPPPDLGLLGGSKPSFPPVFREIHEFLLRLGKRGSRGGSPDSQESGSRGAPRGPDPGNLGIPRIPIFS